MAIGYRCLYRSPDAGNYLRGDERVDFIYASRPAARGLLSNAATIQTAFGEVRVVSTEGLIGLKLQGFVNNPHLMVVVEALCPVWPYREIFSSNYRFMI